MEADLLQIYHINLYDAVRNDFVRIGRLASQLPPDSRVAIASNPAKDWSWDREVMSRILAKLDQIAVMYANSHRKKNSKHEKMDKQFQPDYVEKAKKEFQERKKAGKLSKYSDAEMAAIKVFWAKRNPKARVYG